LADGPPLAANLSFKETAGLFSKSLEVIRAARLGRAEKEATQDLVLNLNQGDTQKPKQDHADSFPKLTQCSDNSAAADATNHESSTLKVDVSQPPELVGSTLLLPRPARNPTTYKPSDRATGKIKESADENSDSMSVVVVGGTTQESTGKAVWTNGASNNTPIDLCSSDDDDDGDHYDDV